MDCGSCPWFRLTYSLRTTRPSLYAFFSHQYPCPPRSQSASCFLCHSGIMLNPYIRVIPVSPVTAQNIPYPASLKHCPSLPRKSPHPSRPLPLLSPKTAFFLSTTRNRERINSSRGDRSKTPCDLRVNYLYAPGFVRPPKRKRLSYTIDPLGQASLHSPHPVHRL